MDISTWPDSKDAGSWTFSATPLPGISENCRERRKQNRGKMLPLNQTVEPSFSLPQPLVKIAEPLKAVSNLGLCLLFEVLYECHFFKIILTVHLFFTCGTKEFLSGKDLRTDGKGLAQEGGELPAHGIHRIHPGGL